MKVLFIGSFLSKKSGTISIAEKMEQFWFSNGGPVRAKLVSRIQNKYLRLISILLNTLTFSGRVVNVDVFSGPSLLLARLAMKVAKIRGLNVILTFRGGAIVNELAARKEEYKELVSHAAHLQSPSQFIIDGIKEILDVEVSYMPNPINLDAFLPCPTTNRNNLLWVRAFTEIYNPKLAVETLSLVQIDFPDTRLTMVGPDKGMLADVKQRIKELQLDDSIDIVGPVANTELPYYYQSHSIYLNTTSYESFGTAVVEAAATGAAIVSSKVGELPYLWTHGENIAFADELTPESFASQVVQLLKDQDYRNSLGAGAMERVKEFEWNQVLTKWQQVFQEISK